MLALMGLGPLELSIFLIVYLIVLALTLRHILNQENQWPLKVATGALVLFVPVIGMGLIWMVYGINRLLRTQN